MAVNDEATPLIVSSIALAFGFGILIFSNFTIVAQFGPLAATTMLFSIFSNLLITPIIMIRIRLVGLYQILAMSIDRDVLDGRPLLHEFEKGKLLVEQGMIVGNMHLILSGEAEVIRRDGNE